MKLKNKWKRFWTLERRANHGFTLVELVVVIAILGILAGAGTAGYAGYVKNANKKADLVTVGNIMRAVDTAANAGLFAPDDSFEFGNISYPIGIITLTSRGTEVLTSSAVLGKTEIEGECEPVSIGTVTYKVPHAWTTTCDKNCNLTGTYYEIVSEEVYYCATHSTASASTYVVNNTDWRGNPKAESVVTGLTHGTIFCRANETTGNIPYGTTVLNNYDQGGFYPMIPGKDVCSLVYGNQYQNFTGTDSDGSDGYSSVSYSTDSALYKAIQAAYSNPESVTLKWNGWGAADDGGRSVASLYTYAPTMFEDVKVLSGQLADYSTSWAVSALESTLGNEVISGEYADSEEVLSSFAAAFNDIFGGDTEEERAAGLASWIDKWNEGGRQPYDQWGFGMDGYNGKQNREYYAACRKVYNSSFASYLSSYGIEDKYVNVVSNFSKSLVGIDSQYELPVAVNTSAFATADTGLNSKFYAAGDTVDTDGDGLFDNFEKCAALYETYKTSDVCTENAKAFYDTIVTIHATSDVACNTNNSAGGDMFAFYQNYLNEFAAIYGEAQKKAGDGIIIIATVSNGKLDYQVSPSAANPRTSD